MSDSCNPMGCSQPGSSSILFPRQEYWSGLPFPSPKDLLTQGLNLNLLNGRFFTDQTKRKADIVSKLKTSFFQNDWEEYILSWDSKQGLPDARAQASEPWIFWTQSIHGRPWIFHMAYKINIYIFSLSTFVFFF